MTSFSTSSGVGLILAIFLGVNVLIVLYSIFNKKKLLRHVSLSNSEKSYLDNTFVNVDAMSEKFAKMKAGGYQGLHIVADFDQTLTAAFTADGRPSQSTWEVFTEDFGDAYEKQRKDYLATYLPIEKDATVPLEEKKLKMHEWWSKHLNLVLSNGVTKEMIHKAAISEHLVPRQGLKELLAFAHTQNIPVLIFSAGLGDVIKDFFASRDMLFSNMHIISNFFTFDQSGKALAFDANIIHSCNKSEVQIGDKSYAGQIMNRPNVLLLGNSLSDIDMTQGIEHENVIKLGFLNGDKDNFEVFRNLYDIVFEEDRDMSYVLILLASLKNSISESTVTPVSKPIENQSQVEMEIPEMKKTVNNYESNNVVNSNIANEKSVEEKVTSNDAAELKMEGIEIDTPHEQDSVTG